MNYSRAKVRCNLQGIRTYKNWTQEVLAMRSNVSVSTIRLLEKGGHAKLTKKIRIANALGFNVIQIWPVEES